MAALRKWVELLIPDRYKLSSGTVLTVTPADCRNAVAQGRRMLAAGLRVPLCWGHQEEAEPLYLGHEWPVENVSRDLFGELRGYRLGTGGRVEGLVDIPDPADARQFLKVNGVSPRLQRNWVDEKWHRWPGLTVGHLAATPTPIARHLRRPADLGHHARPARVRVRIDPRNVYDFAQAVRGSAVADENKDKAGATVGDSGAIGKIMDYLDQLGVPLARETVTDLDSLANALANAVSVKNGGAATADDLDDDDDAAAANTAAAAAPPAFMSHFTRAAKTVTIDYKARARRLRETGRVDAKTYDKLAANLGKADLSHTDFDGKTGDLKKRPVHLDIEAYERLPAGKFDRSNRTPAPDDRADLSHTDQVEQPGVADAKAKEAAARQLMNEGLPALPGDKKK